MNKKLAFMTAVAGLLLAASPVWAHHAFAAEFDSGKLVKVQGTVVKVEMVNPHSWIHIDVKNPDGTITHWMFEGGSPNALVRHGFTKGSLPEGTEVIVEGFQAKDGSFRASGRDIMLPNGKKMNLAGSSGDAPQNGADKK